MRQVLALQGLATVLAAAALAAPAQSHRRNIPDPAVVHANRIGTHVYTEGYLGKGDQRIHYVATGEGPTVILVHGFPSFWYAWFDQMEAFGACRRMIAIDAPGANLSGRPARDSAYRVEALARRLDRVIAALAPREKVTLVGHDWGGALAWSYAQWKHERLDRLVVFSAPPTNLFLTMLTDDPQQRAASAYIARLMALERQTIVSARVPQTLFEVAYGKQIGDGTLTQEEGELFRAALADPAAMADEALEEYSIQLTPIDEITPVQAVILAVPHKEYVEGGWPLVRRLMNGAGGVVIDVKSILPRDRKPHDVDLWRL